MPFQPLLAGTASMGTWHPHSLRAGTWRAAVGMQRVHPLPPVLLVDRQKQGENPVPIPAPRYARARVRVEWTTRTDGPTRGVSASRCCAGGVAGVNERRGPPLSLISNPPRRFKIVRFCLTGCFLRRATSSSTTTPLSLPATDGRRCRNVLSRRRRAPCQESKSHAMIPTNRRTRRDPSCPVLHNHHVGGGNTNVSIAQKI